VPTQVTAPKSAERQRYVALDAFRGFIMLILVSEGFDLAGLAKRNLAYISIAGQFDHRPWEWIAFWDLIQPAWLVSLCRLRLPALLMSQILLSIERGHLFFQLTNVLAQIAITYFLCYLIMQLTFRRQVAVAMLLLIGHWALFVMFPGTEGPFFSKTTNVGAVIDHFVFGRDNPGYWVSINFITSTVTTLFGVWTGQLLASPGTHIEKMRILGIAAVACLALGLLIHPLNPIIKRICTSSLTIYSTGWVLLMLLAFYWIVEVKNRSRRTFPLIVIGANSIFIYSVDMILHGWLNKSVAAFTQDYRWLGEFAPVAQSCTVLLVMWYLCYWLYRREIFFKL
jgi:heparan-alpha-glucosaminide N-acetyltransferase